MTERLVEKIAHRLKYGSPAARAYEQPMTWDEASQLLAALKGAEGEVKRYEAECRGLHEECNDLHRSVVDLEEDAENLAAEITAGEKCMAERLARAEKAERERDEANKAEQATFDISARLLRERDTAVAALEEISKPRYGLETNADVHESREYWENVALDYRKIARAALASNSGGGE